MATIEELCSATKRAEITVKQALARIDYLSSYDNNSRFYALRSTCRFNRYGIWKHDKASFTRHGTLAALLTALVDKSRAGHTGRELETITGGAVASALRLVTKKGKLLRIRWKGEYVYFTTRSKRAQGAQAKARFGSTKLLGHLQEEISTEELKKTIVILLEIIRSRPARIRQLRQTLLRTHPEISGSMVAEVCRRYDIRLKKKIDRHQVFEIAVKIAESFQEQTGRCFAFHFAPDPRNCPTCGNSLTYYKTTKARTVKTLRYGPVCFRESQVVCRSHRYDPEEGSPLIYGSSFARSLAPANAPIAYDVIAEIGKKRFLNYRQVEEVVEELSVHDIELSSSSVSRWADFFLAAVECLHHTKIQKLRCLIKGNGGYLLHIDATTEAKSDTVFVCVDRLLGAVLLSEKISSENEQEVETVLKRIKGYFGIPLAIMRDMSVQIASAVRKVFPDVPDRICQFHFLRDIGRDLLQKHYVETGRRMATLKINTSLRRMKRVLEKRLPEEKVRNASILFMNIKDLDEIPTSAVREHEDVLALRLVVDVLDYTQDGEGLGFPFDLYRLHFLSRLNRLRLRLSRYGQRHPRVIRRCPHLQKLGQITARVSDAFLRQKVRLLRLIHRDFEALRSVLRFEIKGGAPLATTMSIGTLKEIRAYNRGLLDYTKRLLAARQRTHLTDAQEIILKHLVTHQFKLPIPEQLAELLSQLDRTNNFEESMFRDLKRHQRRQLGKKDISREFSFHGPYLPLMQNLRNDNYVAAMIGDMKDLPIRISELDSRDIDHYLQKLKENRRGKFFEYLKKINGIDVLPGYF